MSVKRMVVRRLAEAELAEAKAWYELRSVGLGERFLAAFEEGARAIAEGPMRWPVYHKTVRRYRMAQFPHLIYFEVRGDIVRILRVVHASKDPQETQTLLG